MEIVQATERFTKIEFQADQDWDISPQAIYTCPHCHQEIVFNMSHFAEGTFQYFSNLIESDAKQFDEAIQRVDEDHNSFLDFYCPGCKAPIRVYYLAWAGGRFTHGYRLHIVAEGNP